MQGVEVERFPGQILLHLEQQYLNLMHFTQLIRGATAWARTTPPLPMPNVEDRLPQNVSGRFYVDSTCIDCDLCRGNAPDFFRRDDEILSLIHI